MSKLVEAIKNTYAEYIATYSGEIVRLSPLPRDLASTAAQYAMRSHVDYIREVLNTPHYSRTCRITVGGAKHDFAIYLHTLSRVQNTVSVRLCGVERDRVGCIKLECIPTMTDDDWCQIIQNIVIAEFGCRIADERTLILDQIADSYVECAKQINQALVPRSYCILL